MSNWDDTLITRMSHYIISEVDQETIREKIREECTKNTSSLAGYCQQHWDDIACWPFTAAGQVAVQPCPSYFLGFNQSRFASKKCEADGQWYKSETTKLPWANYSMCSTEPFTRVYVKLPPPKVPDVIWEYVPAVQKVSQVGYGISLITLFVAFCILASFKKLRCPRNLLHLHLFTSFMMRSFFSLLKAALFFYNAALPNYRSEQGDTYLANDLQKTWTCRIVLTCWQYFQVANYAWLFMEGLYLHNLIFLALFSDTSSIYIYTFFGWGLPFLFVAAWVVLRTLYDNELCWTTNNNLFIYSVIRVPIIISILLNFCMFINIVRVLMLKLRASMSEETQRLRRWAKSTLVLVPLLGVQYVLSLAISAIQDDTIQILWLFFDQLLGSFQGSMVAILYCFMNSEVRAELVQLRTKTNCCRKRRRRDRRAMTDSRDFQEMNFFSLGSSNATSKSYLPNSLEGKYSVRFIENDDTLTNSRRGSGNDDAPAKVGLLSEKDTHNNHRTGN
ncbi:unnamed protein product [Bemisia tabaci]|uniref:Uncharacterized protein n=1 Tax=Bemisia tabaci TaxID=7038 RepID=A0A9P0A3I3_BEMTA|nr:unnamed protein product [Bemisia tabaci]